MGTEEGILLARRIELSNNSSECNRLFEFLNQGLDQLPVNPEFRHDLKLVCEELLANIINHGYDRNTDNRIDIELIADDSSVHITFTDSGVAFNPLETTMPVASDDLSEGGMGILLVKSLTDRQHYERREGFNVLTVTKNYNK
ncbi:MAG: ATP-binding protein [Thiotrichales bacterium]|nr:MAG: ATP-binding protein [Thiotrichales bacterium]